MRRPLIFLFSSLLFISACRFNRNFDSVTQGEFTISDVPDEKPRMMKKYFNKYVEVFGVQIYASHKVSNDKVFHCANVMAQYLDNDEDGVPDNPLVVEEMVKRNAYMMMFHKRTMSGQNVFLLRSPKDWAGQDLGGYETRPEGSGPSGFDATLEEVLHLITHEGYARVYPEVFGEQKGSIIANAMDIARGGQFDDIPDSYPDNAWYTYDDKTCDYSCMVTEYTYWALTSILGAQAYSGRLEEINNEWDLNTHDLVQTTDPAVYDLLTNPDYHLPSVLPDGTYRQ